MANVAASLHHGALDRPVVRRIGFEDLRYALQAGWADFLAVPTQLLFLAMLYPMVVFIGARAAYGGMILPLVFPLVTGLSLMGPVLAVGLYEISRRREAGLPTSWRNAFDPFRSPAFLGIVALAVMLFFLFALWIGVARAIFASTVGLMSPESVGDFLDTLMASPAFGRLVVWGNLVGGLFAIVVLTVSAVSFPMLLDRNVSPGTAVATSVRIVLRNPVTMAAWGALVALILALGCLPLFVGLAVAMPVLGHATWHLYRRTVG